MEKFINLELEFLNISEEERGGYVSLCQVIDQYHDLPIQVYHRMRCFFDAFYQWRNGKISDETFLSTGDESSETPLFGKTKISSWELFTTEQNILDSLTEKTLIIADEKSYIALSLTQQEEIQKKLKKSDSLLLLC